jgi:hypothetical protein
MWKIFSQVPETVTTWLPLTSGNVQPDVTDWKTLNPDNYWKYNWPSHHPLRRAGPGNNDDVAVSHVSKRPAPLRAAFPKIAAFHTDMPTILLPTALLFVCIDSRATSERWTNLSDNVMSERLPRSRPQCFFLFFPFFFFFFNVEIFAKFRKISRSYTTSKNSKIFPISLSTNGEISPGKKTLVHILIAMISLCIHFYPLIETAPIFQPMWCLKSSWRVPAAMAMIQSQAPTLIMPLIWLGNNHISCW